MNSQNINQAVENMDRARLNLAGLINDLEWHGMPPSETAELDSTVVLQLSQQILDQVLHLANLYERLCASYEALVCESR